MVEAVNINGINSLQQLRANQAFKAAKNVNNNIATDTNADEDVNIQDKESKVFFDFISPEKKQILTKESFEEIKNVAQSITTDISEDDIKYGLKYGRSVLVDVKA